MGLIPGLGRSAGGGHGTLSSVLAWRISQTERPGELQSIGHKESDTIGTSTPQVLGIRNWTSFGETQFKPEQS